MGAGALLAPYSHSTDKDRLCYAGRQVSLQHLCRHPSMPPSAWPPKTMTVTRPEFRNGATLPGRGLGVALGTQACPRHVIRRLRPNKRLFVLPGGQKLADPVLGTAAARRPAHSHVTLKIPSASTVRGHSLPRIKLSTKTTGRDPRLAHLGLLTTLTRNDIYQRHLSCYRKHRAAPFSAPNTACGPRHPRNAFPLRAPPSLAMLASTPLEVAVSQFAVIITKH